MRGIITDIAGPGSFVTRAGTELGRDWLETKNQRETELGARIERSRLIVSDIFLGLKSLMFCDNDNTLIQPQLPANIGHCQSQLSSEQSAEERESEALSFNKYISKE